MEWRTVAVTILVVTLCFLAIPIRVGPDNNSEDIKLFENYVAKYNKSYKNNPTEYSDRFERFQVKDTIYKLSSYRPFSLVLILYR